MNYTKSIILSIAFAFNAYFVHSQTEIVQSESGLLSLKMMDEGKLYEHKISILNGYNLMDYNIEDSIITVVYIPKKRARQIIKDVIFISMFKMIEKDQLYIQKLYSSTFNVVFNNEQDLRFRFSGTKNISIDNQLTDEKTAIEMDLVNEKCLLFRNDNKSNPETVILNKSKQWLINKDGTVINP